LDIYNPIVLFLREQGCKDPWLFFEAKSVCRQRKFWKYWSRVYITLEISS